MLCRLDSCSHSVLANALVFSVLSMPQCTPESICLKNNQLSMVTSSVTTLYHSNPVTTVTGAPIYIYPNLISNLNPQSNIQTQSNPHNTIMAEQSNPLPLQNRVAIVTGGSRGIGKAISLHLASLGAKLIINYNSNSTQADLLVSQINSNSSSNSNSQQSAISVKADVSDPNQVKDLFDAAQSAFDSPVYILVNAAGIMDASYSSIPNSSLEQFDRIFEVNTRGAYLCCKEAANRLKKGGGGRIVCITTSLVGALKPGYGAYTASKAAVEAMVKILAKELKGTGITANCVAPGPIATELFFEGKTEEMVKKAVEQIPLGRLGVPENVAPLVGFLVSDGGEWVNGQVVRVNGGFV